MVYITDSICVEVALPLPQTFSTQFQSFIAAINWAATMDKPINIQEVLANVRTTCYDIIDGHSKAAADSVFDFGIAIGADVTVFRSTGILCGLIANGLFVWGRIANDSRMVCESTIWFLCQWVASGFE